ncbi:MAG TPA: ATP-binding protein [Steroidobacteraceae bacterium]
MPDARRRALAILAFTAALLAILAIGIVSYVELATLANSSAQVQRSYEVLQTLDDLNGALTDAETNERGFLLTHDAAYITQYDDAVAQVRLTLTELHRLSSTDADTQRAVGHLARLAGAKLEVLQRSISALQGGQPPAALATLVEGSGKRLMAAFQRDAAEVQAVQRRRLETHRRQEQRARFSSGLVLAATVMLSLLLVGAAATISRRFEERRRRLEMEIAERRRAQEYRESLLASERTARSEAERATRLKDEFVATLSHELRTPLNAIVGWATILNNDRRPETIAQGVEVIERNAKVQTQMIEELLDMSRILSGKLRVEFQPMELSGVLENALAAVRPTADAKAILLELHARRVGPVSGDAGRLQQVVWNLLNNAIKFTPPGGKVAVVVEEVDGHAQIRVADSGQGIKAEFLPFVFDRFRQADASTTRRHGGLGLGLSIVKSLVEIHGGTVEVQSPGEALGTVFIVRLPICCALPRPAPMPVTFTAAATPALRGLRILVVDDEADARTLARRVLEESGAQVLTVTSAAEALAALGDDSSLSMLVSDIGMPDEDGYELIRRMRSLPGAAGRMPAIALTALARSEDCTRALQSGYQRHVSKPVDPAELVAVIAHVAGREQRPAHPFSS